MSNETYYIDIYGDAYGKSHVKINDLKKLRILFPSQKSIIWNIKDDKIDVDVREAKEELKNLYEEISKQKLILSNLS